MPYTVIDLFSGGGGMSYGFHTHTNFEIVAAFDAQIGKPSSAKGSLQCNQTYQANMGFAPFEVDLAEIPEKELQKLVKSRLGKKELDVMISCAPCTGFSRAKSNNHLLDDPRNSLVKRSADFVVTFKPKIFIMENARELLQGNFTGHFLYLKKKLESAGYKLKYSTHFLSDFGLPQKRERALIIATNRDFEPYGLEDLWQGYTATKEAISVRRAISWLPKLEAGEKNADDACHSSPSLKKESLQRIMHIPADGGSWVDLLNIREGKKYLIPSMLRSVEKGKLGSYPDVYGRMKWDLPAATIKRECAHIGNGRYSHPEQHRLCSVREMGLLQGFPKQYQFKSSSLANMYRHIGDAVPPLISFQIANICNWILTNKKPNLNQCILEGCSLGPRDIIKTKEVCGNLNLAI
ncbi:DNA cytosine methyltransferase [Microbulbifer sp. OS29]|uniref:DNA (cytosine-5-)-methyltransferase n=1 Tax=Microbulbifer okhotskensis TaxID=2926617 RepID=A0A9X2J6R0_9GAMM|nr:DNA cytosine methyltransferase [Microbulbifer okhotskensis]MCO1335684.1 DNA cytosine methyltransferase [Microbulbifer okhotskensis]